MRKYLAVMGVISAGLSLNPAQAATLNGDELRGHTVDVLFSDGTRNNVYFDANGRAIINSPDGQIVDANWFVQNQQICLQTTAASECWSYLQRFEAGQAMSLSSSCNETSQWTARSVNPVRQEVAPAIIQGERG